VFCSYFSYSYFNQLLFKWKNNQLLLSDVEEIKVEVEGNLINPIPSPSNKYLAFTKENYKGIFIYDFESKKSFNLQTLTVQALALNGREMKI